jgi:hypothetical protein
MRLFKRQTFPDNNATCCTECGERVPRGAAECAMCGHDLNAGDARSHPGTPLNAPSDRSPTGP